MFPDPWPAWPDRELHVWVIELPDGLSANASAMAVLSEDERIRAARFRFEQDRSRYVWSHWMLRKILGRYLDLAPERLAFAVTSNDKPYLTGIRRSIEFNLTHTAGLAAVAVSAGRKVGVDVEALRPMEDYDSIARLFTAGERAKLAAVPAEQSTDAFFRCWTRKEAVVKAMAGGLAEGLDRFEVTFLPGEPPEVRPLSLAEGTQNWGLYELEVPKGFMGAVVCEGHPVTLRQFDLSLANLQPE